MGRINNDQESIAAQVRDILVLDVIPDGMEALSDSVKTELITEEADYSGVRVRFLATLDSARVLAT